MTKKSTCPPKPQRRRALYIITKSVWGGAAKYVYDLATCLSKEDFEVFIAAGPAPAPYRDFSGTGPEKARYGKGNQGKFAQKIKESNLPYFNISNFQRSINPFKDIFAFFEVLILLLKLKPDIIHINSPKAGGITAIASLAYKIFTFRSLRLIYTPHGWALKEDRPKWQIFLIRFFSKLTCLFYNKIICVSEYDRKIALENKISPPNKIIFIHNGIDVDQITFFPKEKARKKLIPDTKYQIQDTKIIGTIAEWNKNKGLFYLLEAVMKIRNPSTRRLLAPRSGNNYPANSNLYPEPVEGYKFDVILIGSGENTDKEKMYNFVRKHNLENVHLIEWIDNAASYLKAFDVFVLPSIKEGFPYAILEAMAAELSIITTPVGGIPEAIENNVNGILVHPKNSQILAEKILYLINNPEKAREISKRAREKVEKEFSLEKMVRETKNVYFSNFPAKTS